MKRPAARFPRELSTYDWVSLRDPELRARGADPSDRLRFTGQRRPLQPQWADSIGVWGAHEACDLVDDEASQDAVLHVTKGAFRQFKSRYRLLTRREFALLHGSHAWARAELCYAEHARAQRTFDAHGALAPIGVACEYASLTMDRKWRTKGFGLLPVEIVLWTRVFDAFLDHHGVSHADWKDLGHEHKASIWGAGLDGAAWDVALFIDAPAVRQLGDGTLAAAG